MSTKGKGKTMSVEEMERLAYSRPSVQIREQSKYRDKHTKITLYARPNESGNLWYYFRFNNKTWRGPCGTAYWQDALRYAVQVKEGLKKGVSPKKQKKALGYVVQEFLTFKKDKVKPSSFNGYSKTLKKIREYLGDDYQINDITFETLENYCVWRRTEKPAEKREMKRYNRVITVLVENIIPSDKTLNWEIVQIRTFILWAKKRSYYTADVPEFEYYKIIQKKRMILKEEQLIAVQDWFKKNAKPYQLTILQLVSLVGLRYPSEIKKMKFEHINFEQKILEIPDRKARSADVDAPLSENALSILKKLKEQSKGKGKVFPKWDCSYYWGKCLDELGINREIKIYSLRHFYTVNALKKGMPAMLVAKSLGHSSLAQIEQHYGSFVNKDLVEAVERYLD